MPEPRTRVLVVVFDALRPDMVSAERMPNLSRLAGEGVRYSRSRATFPSETRVNQAALVTGCYPTRHGIVGNHFLEPTASPEKLFNTGDETALAAGDRLLDGRLVDVPVLGELLAAAGRSLAVLSAGTPGGTRMLHHRAERVGGFRLALHRPDACVPEGVAESVAARIGPIPEHRVPSTEWLGYTTDAYLEYVEPELAPDVTILWYCEPDNSFHYRGIGSPDSLAALARADHELGRLLEWRDRGPGDALQIVTLSDHGQLTIEGEPVGLAGRLAEAGFRVGPRLDDGTDLAVAVDCGGGIWVRDSEPALVEAVAAWLARQTWCGPLLTRDGRFGLRHAWAGIDHPRAGDLGVVLSSDGRANGAGWPGHTRHDSRYPAGGGLHGGLHPLELHNWLALAGDRFAAPAVLDTPAGIVDVLPTILALLGIDPPPGLDGRILREALAGHPFSPLPEARTGILSADGAGGRRYHLEVTRLGTSRYLDRGWAE